MQVSKIDTKIPSDIAIAINRREKLLLSWNLAPLQLFI